MPINIDKDKNVCCDKFPWSFRDGAGSVTVEDA